MNKDMIYIAGAGGIGMPLAAFLTQVGVPVTAIRTSTEEIEPHMVDVLIEMTGGEQLRSRVCTASLSTIGDHGAQLIAVTAKATANRVIAPRLYQNFGDVPLVVLQNGIDVELPFIEAGFRRIYRCVVYATGQRTGANTFRFGEVAPSPLGAIAGDAAEASRLAETLSTSFFRFVQTEQITRDVWKKTIINAAFNSICPLLNTDNGIFHRQADVARIAQTIAEESNEIARERGIDLTTEALMEQLLLISQRSDGQLISTLQDLNGGRETEINFMNLAISRAGAALTPPIDPKATRILGELILAKSAIARSGSGKD